MTFNLRPMSCRRSRWLYELAFRESGGTAVALLWDGISDRVFLNVRDSGTGEWFMCGVERASALDAFRHPFAYAPRHSMSEGA